MKNVLPRINIEGTVFIIDIAKEELREKNNPKNIVNIKKMSHDDNGYHFHYDSRTKNLASLQEINNPGGAVHIKLLSMPDLTHFGPPAGISQNLNRTADNRTGSNDAELDMQQGSLFDLRWNRKILPRLTIAGHTFFVDTAAGKLRPKDDFKSKGISLDQISSYYDRSAKAYIIPYNPRTRQFQEIDHLKITELPKDILVVKFPHLQELDRVGWNVKYGFGPAHRITDKEFRLHFRAHTLRWEQTNIPSSIKLNLEQKRNQQKNMTADENRPEDALPIKRGPKL